MTVRLITVDGDNTWRFAPEDPPPWGTGSRPCCKR
jgi:hypothetical protein